MGSFRLMAQLRHLFTVDVTLAKWTGQNQYSEATYGAAVLYKARIEPATLRIEGENRQVLSVTKVLLNEYVEVDPRDRLGLPAGYGTRSIGGAFEAAPVRIMKVDYLTDHEGPICTVLYCGRS
jgi:hypothetical protein